MSPRLPKGGQRRKGVNPVANSTIKKALNHKIIDYEWIPTGAGTLTEITISHEISNGSARICSITVVSGNASLIATIRTYGMNNVKVLLDQRAAISGKVNLSILIAYE